MLGNHLRSPTALGALNHHHPINLALLLPTKKLVASFDLKQIMSFMCMPQAQMDMGAGHSTVLKKQAKQTHTSYLLLQHLLQQTLCKWGPGIYLMQIISKFLIIRMTHLYFGKGICWGAIFKAELYFSLQIVVFK